MSNVDMCEHDWPGSGCKECRAEAMARKITAPSGTPAMPVKAIINGLRGEVAELQSMITNLSRAGIRMRTERDQLAQRLGELEGLLRDSAELIKHGVFEDGYCCCGSSVDSHGLGDGHSPVDALAYHAGQVCERIDAALSAGKEG